MAIAAAAVWEIRSSATAGNVNGGFFVTGASGVDYSQQDAAQYALTGVTSAGAGNTVLTASAATDMVGNGIKVVSGTNFTASWFEITSVVAGVSITCSTNAAGASISTGVGAAGVMNVGGAMSMGSSLDDDMFEAGTAGNKFYVKNGTYTLGEAVTISLAGTADGPIVLIGYNSARDDDPAGLTRPLFICGANAFTPNVNWTVKSMRLHGTGANVLSLGATNKAYRVQARNTSTTADRVAINYAANNLMFLCEGISYRGRAFSSSAANGALVGCYAHASQIGVLNTSTTGSVYLVHSILADCNTAAFSLTAANTASNLIVNSTLFGAINTHGIGVSMVSGVSALRLINSIISGFATGVSHADVQNIGLDEFNDYYNNDTDATNWTKGATDLALDPQFTSVTQITGTAGKFAAGNVTLQDDSKNFTALGVTASDPPTHFVNITGGTGFTAGFAGITSITTTTNANDTLGLDITVGTNTTADKTYQIMLGANFKIGTNLKAAGAPGVFPDATTQGYLDIGGVQREEAASGGGGGQRVIGG